MGREEWGRHLEPPSPNCSSAFVVSDRKDKHGNKLAPPMVHSGFGSRISDFCKWNGPQFNFGEQ